MHNVMSRWPTSYWLAADTANLVAWFANSSSCNVNEALYALSSYEAAAVWLHPDFMFTLSVSPHRLARPTAQYLHSEFDRSYKLINPPIIAAVFFLRSVSPDCFIIYYLPIRLPGCVLSQHLCTNIHTHAESWTHSRRNHTWPYHRHQKWPIIEAEKLRNLRHQYLEDLRYR